MERIFSGLENVIEESVSKCKADYLALSGGLDSSIIGYFLQKKKITGIAIITKDFVGNDLTYCQLISKEFKIPLILESISTENLLTAVENTIKILQVFNDIEIRNAVVMYLVFEKLQEKNVKSVITGDGADELFAGYNFFLQKDEDELEKDLKRIWKIMHFPTKKLGEHFKIDVESPFLDQNVIEFAKKIPVNMKVKNENGKKYGKWILRKCFEKKLPKSIVWRNKSPMQNGAGTAALTQLFEILISDVDFEKKKIIIKNKDDVIIRTKESLHYYEIFRKFSDAPKELHSSNKKCPYCKFEVATNLKFCRMCGSFPI